MYSFILSVLLSCLQTSPQINYDTGISQHVKTFEKLCNCSNFVPIFFTKLPGDRIGECRWFEGPENLRTVHIDPDFWKDADFYERESLILHELGHCVLNKHHDNSMVYVYGMPMPASLMNSHNFWEYRYFRQYYLAEFFKDLKPIKVLTCPEIPAR